MTNSNNINRAGYTPKQNYATKEGRKVTPESGCILCNMSNQSAVKLWKICSATRSKTILNCSRKISLL